MINIQTISDASSNNMQVILPHELNRSTGMCSNNAGYLDGQLVNPKIYNTLC
jgi:hypothetical protein